MQTASTLPRIAPRTLRLAAGRELAFSGNPLVMGPGDGTSTFTTGLAADVASIRMQEAVGECAW